MTKPRVLLADDHALVLDGLHKILEEHCEIVGRAEDGRLLLDAVARLEPDVVIADISMPGLNGIDAARQLRKTSPRTRVIFVTMHADPAYVSAAFKAGASGYLLKRSAGTELIQAVQSVMQGHSYVTPLIATTLVNAATGKTQLADADEPTLTPRQREVLQLVAEGHTVKDIARILDISPKTVEFHKTQIMDLLNLHTTADLTKYAMTHGLTSPE